MRIRLFALLILGAVMALVAGGATYSYTRSMESELTSARAAVNAFGSTRAVPVPKRDITRGETVTPEDFGMLAFPQGHLPQGILLELPQASPEKPMVALTDLARGAMLLASAIGQPQAAQITGMTASFDGRVIAISPANLADYQGQLEIGTMVDLFWTHDNQGTAGETRLIGNALRILDIAPKAASGSAEARLYLEVGLRDAARVLEAGQGGTYNILPSKGILEVGADIIEVSPTDLISLPLAVRAPSSLASAPTLRADMCRAGVVRAGHRAEVEVPC